jgi:hypothetical protein
MNKENVVYIPNVILFSNKSEMILLFAATCVEWMDILLSEISQEQKDKYCMLSPTCGS